MSRASLRPLLSLCSFLPLVCTACDATLNTGAGARETPDAPPNEAPSPVDGPTSPPITGSGGAPPSVGISRSTLEEACAARSGDLEVGVTKMRRVSAIEFNHTIEVLTGGPYVDYSEGLPDDEPMGPFVSNQSLPVGIQELRQYRALAEAIADEAIANGASFLPCTPPTTTDASCVGQFIDEVVPRVYRRPLEDDEADALMQVFALGRDGASGSEPDLARGLRLLLRAIIGSPHLLYITDTGASGIPAELPEPASAFALASRLSLAFWNAPPDEELIALSESGALLEESVYAEQVERILNDPRAQDAMAHFFAQLTGIIHLLHKQKSPDLFPEFDAELAQEMLSEQEEFVKSVIFSRDGTWSALLSTNYEYPGPALADLYGVSAATPTVLPESERRGLFTQAGYLAAHNKPNETSPVHLGINIREAILCEVMPPPPPGIDTTLPATTAEIRTSRDRFLLHETGPCKNCHELIDPIGLAFEHYDAIGAYRETDNGAPIDPTGQIVSAQGGEDGPPFTGALELTEQLASSVQVRDCIARQMLRSALDRQESLFDACTTLDLVKDFEATGGSLRQLLSQIAHSPAFKHVVLNPPSEVQP